MKAEEAPRGELDGEFHEIHMAARNRDVDRIRRLLASGVDVNLRNKVLPNGDGGNSPLWFASQGPRGGGKEVAAVLIEAGADVNQVCEHGTTAAHMACSWGREDVLELLYQSGADLSIKDVDGMTPEMTARHGYNWQLTGVSGDKRAGVIAFFDRPRFREMTIADHERAMALMRVTPGIGLSEADSREAVEAFLARNPGLSFVAEQAEEIIGCAMCGHDGRRGYLHHVVVKESERGKGIGSRLVNHCLEKLESLGIVKTHIHVFRSNELADAYWASKGWHRRDDLHVFSFMRSRECDS